MMISRLPCMSCSLVIFGAIYAAEGCGYRSSGLIVLIGSPMRNILGTLRRCLHIRNAGPEARCSIGHDSLILRTRPNHAGEDVQLRDGRRCE